MRRIYSICLVVLVIVALASGIVLFALARPAPATPIRRHDPVLSASRIANALSNVASRVGLDRRLRPLVETAPGSMCVVTSNSFGSVLFDDSPDIALIPASTTKLFTAAAALDGFGPDHRFKTEVLVDASGAVYLRGGGDPTLVTEAWIASNGDRLGTPITGLAAAVQAAGIDFAAGVGVDDSHLDDTQRVASWDSVDIRAGFAPQVGALGVNRPRAADDGADPAAAAGRALLSAAGVSGPVSEAIAPFDAQVVAAIESPPLSAIVADMNKWSDNYIAEVLMRHIGSLSGSATTDGGVEAVVEYFSGIVEDPGELEIVDGSGLSPANRISCDDFDALLPATQQDADFADVFFDSLAVGGVDGTLEDRGPGAVVHAKTGTLSDVSALVGFVDTAAGRLPFAILINEAPSIPQARSLQDRLVAAIAQWPSP